MSPKKQPKPEPAKPKRRNYNPPVGPRPGTTGRVTPFRLAEVRRLLGKCMATGNIEKQLAAKWGVSTTTIHNYITRVFKEMAAEDVANRPFRKERLREAIENQVQTCQDARAHNAANRALDLLGRVDGCFAPIEITGEGGAPIQMAVAHTLDLENLADDELSAFARAVKKLEPQKSPTKE